MFKKSLAAVAVLGAFAASSFAADVTFYGKVDMGLQYKNAETTSVLGVKDTEESLKLDSGVGLASRIGLKATEDLGNGDKVAFKLEGDFATDDGTLAKNKLWQREASLSYIGNWGTLYAGRYGSFSGAAGSTDIVMSRMDVFDGGHKGSELLGLGRMDNALSYISPKFAGFQAAAMYSFKNDNTKAGDEGHANTDKYAGLAMTYDIGALQTAVSYEQVLRGNTSKFDDGKIISFGGNYDFDMFKVFFGAQVFEGMDKIYGSADALDSTNEYAYDYLKNTHHQDAFNPDGTLTDAGKNVTIGMTRDGIEGYGLHAGVEFQALAGNWEFGMYYADAELDALAKVTPQFGVDGEYFGVNGRYIYKLSNRTEIRSSVAYQSEKWEGTDASVNDSREWKKDSYLACVSLTHNF